MFIIFIKYNQQNKIIYIVIYFLFKNEIGKKI